MEEASIYAIKTLQDKLDNEAQRTACLDRRLNEVAEWINAAVNLDHVRAEALEKEAVEVECFSGSLYGKCSHISDDDPCDLCLAAARMKGRAKALKEKT